MGLRDLPCSGMLRETTSCGFPRASVLCTLCQLPLRQAPAAAITAASTVHGEGVRWWPGKEADSLGWVWRSALNRLTSDVLAFPASELLLAC